MPSVYVETSVVSYATSRLSTVPHVLVRQQQARRWWELQSPLFDVFISQAVLDECGRGDSEAAIARLDLLQRAQVIPVTAEMSSVAAALMTRSLLPPQAETDALHVAIAAVADVNYLLTLNLRHIANAFRLPMIYAALDELGVSRPLICTPGESWELTMATDFGDDPILDELHAIRRDLLSEAGGDLKSLVAALQSREQISACRGRKFATVPVSGRANPRRTLGEIQDEIGHSASANGMTPQILEAILNGTVPPGMAPLALPPT